MQLWGLTDPGNLREQNQDSYAMVSFSRDRSLMIVCDGMGGANPETWQARLPSTCSPTRCADARDPA